MKKGLVVGMAITLFSVISTTSITAQDTTTVGEDLGNAAKKTGRAVKKSAKKVGNKTAEIASKGKAAVVDKIYEGKEGPAGQTIYINNKAKYYWIDKKGQRHYVTESQLRDKQD